MSTVFPGSEALLKKEILSLLRKVENPGLTPEDVGFRVGGGNQKDVDAALASLQAEGEAFELHGRWYGDETGSWAAGTVEVLESGDA
ncbi:MAG TPA: hypothetical protein VE078_19630, partial [Thermoanaerobaculia bacterium]|nr:hypothetical protein [Thermoanaerobaculia bacterium]